MKLENRISSIRRIAWKTVQIMLGRLALDVARFVRQQRACRVVRSPAA